MRTGILMLFLTLASPVHLIAEEPAKKPTSEGMVTAARAAKANRKKPVSKVLTNADVKKSKAKLLVVAGPAPADDKTAGNSPTSLEDQERRRKLRLAAEETIVVIEKKVAGLERSVEELEQQYYRENDPTYRDSVIRDRFTQARRQLEESRLELANARDVLTRNADPSQPTTDNRQPSP